MPTSRLTIKPNFLHSNFLSSPRARQKKKNCKPMLIGAQNRVVDRVLSIQLAHQLPLWTAIKLYVDDPGNFADLQDAKRRRTKIITIHPKTIRGWIEQSGDRAPASEGPVRNFLLVVFSDGIVHETPIVTTLNDALAMARDQRAELLDTDGNVIRQD